MDFYECVEAGVEYSDDPARIDLDWLHDRLARQSYWLPGVPRAVVRRSIQGSLCFGAYRDGAMVGFARVVTDRATFGYLADVFVDESARGQSLGKRLTRFVLDHPALQHLRRFLLATRDAHGLYAQFGFAPLASPQRFMEIYAPDAYRHAPLPAREPVTSADEEIAAAAVARATRLDVSGRELRHLPEAVVKLSHLRELFGHRNRLVALPEAIGDLAALELLDLSENALTTFPQSIGRLSKLRLLYCSQARLAKLPGSLTDLRALTYLNVCNNALSRLPTSIGGIEALADLRVDGNRLTELPVTVGALSRLRELHARGNRLTALPNSIAALSRLRELHLRGNALSALPEHFGDLGALTTLDLRENRLERLPDGFAELTSLRVLDLRANELREWPAVLADMTHLHKIDLRWNALSAPPPWVLRLEEAGCTIWR